ncbi:DUF6083 domain-containing protein [Streptomyces cinnamoneus]|uniref:DUF6083 domain-containing protein n=1 Tax=Streptomyces cinnamoneus TaxID=53446 RepID=UPI00341AE05F
MTPWQPCRYCGNRMEYCDRFDGGRIPMAPEELPSRQLPARFHRSVFNDTAYPGDGGQPQRRTVHTA